MTAAVLFLLSKYGYRWLNIVRSYQTLKQIALLDRPQEKFYRLRKTDPFLFEEMILTALKQRGHLIIRNKRYTRDGGVDGRVMMGGELHLIQAKRYRGHIKPQHVKAFINLCEENGKRGLFVHTGKTGPLSRRLATNERIDIVSGQRMLSLLNHNSRWATNFNFELEHELS